MKVSGEKKAKMEKNRTVDVRRQRDMTVRETFSLCVKGVKHRLLRSMLTLAVVVLAVAFFMFLLSESVMISSTGRGVAANLEQNRKGVQTMTRILVKPTMPVLVRRLSRASKHGETAVINEAAAVTGWDVKRVADMVASAEKEKIYTDFFAKIPTGKRLALIGRREGRTAIEYVRDNWEKFCMDIAPMVDLKVPGRLDGLKSFVGEYTAYAFEISDFQRLWNAKVDQAAALLAEAKSDSKVHDLVWVETAPAADVEKWRASVTALGFTLSADDLELVRSQLARATLKNNLLAKLNSQEIRTAWTKAFHEKKRTSAEEKMLLLADPRASEVLGAGFDKAALADAAKRAASDRNLARLERLLLVETGDDLPGTLRGRQIFLLCISFVVCMVGIANAMLMSITERFREIATMKCLGATDHYILLQFMMEAALQGIAGGVLGVVVGFAIAFVRNVFVLGSAMFVNWPLLGIISCAVFSLFTGVLLAVLASVQPSWSASRMAPMDAMRVE